MKDISRLKKFVEKNEDVIYYPYLDSENNVTIGIGHNIGGISNPSIEMLMAKVNWLPVSDIKKEIADTVKNFSSVKGMKKLSTHFKKLSHLQVNYSTVESYFISDLADAERKAVAFYNEQNPDQSKVVYGTFDDLPAEVQIVLVDFAFNLRHKGLYSFRSFKKHLKEGEFLKASEESQRNLGKNSPERNNETRAMLIQAHYKYKGATK